MTTTITLGLLSAMLLAAPGQGGPDLATGNHPEQRTEVTIADEGPSPESLTSSEDGSIYFGSTAKGIIYRAAPNAKIAEAWIKPADGEVKNVLGVLADDKSGTLWVCANPSRGDVPRPPMSLRAYDLKSGAAKGAYPVPGEGLINDIAVAADGTVYVSDMSAGRILRLKPRAKEIDVWLSDPSLRGIDGLTLLADGSLYFNNYMSGKLFRVTVGADGTAEKTVELQTSVPFSRPDGLRTTGPKTMLQAEGSGRLTEITIDGDKAEVRVIKEGLGNAPAVTRVGVTAFVLVARSKAVAIPIGK